MGLESGSYIQDLNAANPYSTDDVSQGDDHLRLVKKILKSQFPSLGAQSVSVSASAINNLAGIKGNVQAQLDALEALATADEEIPSNSEMLFYNKWDSNMFGAHWIFATYPSNYMVVVDNDNNGQNAQEVGGSADCTNFSHHHTTDGYTLKSTDIEREYVKEGTGVNLLALSNTQNNANAHTHGDTGTVNIQLRHGICLLLRRI